MPLHTRHVLYTLHRRRTLGDPPHALKDAVVLLPEQLSDQDRVPAALNSGFEVLWFKSGERLDRLDESESNAVVEAVIAGREADVLGFNHAGGHEEVHRLPNHLQRVGIS